MSHSIGEVSLVSLEPKLSRTSRIVRLLSISSLLISSSTSCRLSRRVGCLSHSANATMPSKSSSSDSRRVRRDLGAGGQAEADRGFMWSLQRTSTFQILRDHRDMLSSSSDVNKETKTEKRLKLLNLTLCILIRLICAPQLAANLRMVGDSNQMVLSQASSCETCTSCGKSRMLG